MQKRGISGIIVTVLLVLLALVLVVIIWVVVRNMVKTSTEEIDINPFTYDLNIKKAVIEGTNVKVTIDRGAGGGDLEKTKVIIFNGEESIEEDVTGLEELASGEYPIELSTDFYDPLNPVKLTVKIAPIYLKNGKETLGQVLDEKEVGEGSSTGCEEDGECTTTNPCKNTPGTCNTETGICSFENKADETSCSTCGGDCWCQSGSCEAKPSCVNPATDCLNPRVCETSTGATCVSGVCNYPNITSGQIDTGRCEGSTGCTGGSCKCDGDGTCTSQPVTTENCCNGLDDEGDGLENGADTDCRQFSLLASGAQDVCWWTEWDPYSNNADYISGIFLCPGGTRMTSINLYVKTYSQDHFYVYTRDSTYDKYGALGNQQITPSPVTDFAIFRFTSDASLTDEGVKANSISCTSFTPGTENCCNSADDDGDGNENGYDDDCSGSVLLSNGLNNVCWWTEWDNYNNGRNYFSGLYKCPEGKKVERVNVYYSIEACCDRLYIYDIFNNELARRSGSGDNVDIDLSSYNKNAIKFRFSSDSSVNLDGVKINTIICS